MGAPCDLGGAILTAPTAETIARALGDARRDGREWRTVCPVHGAHGLTVYDGDTGPVWHCHAGCDQAAVTAAIRARWPAPTTRRPAPPPRNRTPAMTDRPTSHPSYGTPSHVARYTPDFEVWRWDRPTGKVIRPLSLTPDGWRWADPPAPLPLYYPRPDDPDLPLLVVEGETTADAAARLFGESHSVATWPHGAQSASRAHWDTIRARPVILWPDADDPGRTAAKAIAERLAAQGCRASVVDTSTLPPAWDVANPAPPGVDLAALLAAAAPVTATGQSRPAFNPIRADVLMSMRFDPVRFVVQSFLPEGLSALSAPPKVGKSRIATELAVAVSTGQPFWGYPTNPCHVLYLDAECDQRGARNRMVSLGLEPTGTLTTECTVPEWRLDVGGLSDLDAYADANPSLGLVIVDTLERLVPHVPNARSLDAYQSGVARLAPVQRWAMRRGIAVLLIHHTSKGGSGGGESYDAASGSRGLTGTAETLLTVTRRDTNTFRLQVESRHMPGLDLAIQRADGRLVPAGDYSEATQSPEREELVAAVARYPEGASLTAIREALGWSYDRTQKTAVRAARDGRLVALGRGRYTVPARTR